MSEAVSPEVLAFLDRHIASVPHLEALLLLWQDPQDAWNASKIAARCYVSLPQARAILEDLGRGALVDVRGVSTEPEYRFNPAAPDAPGVALVAETYRRNLVSVATLIHGRASTPVREFARAFRLKDDR